MKRFAEMLNEISQADHFYTYVHPKYPDINAWLYSEFSRVDPTAKNEQKGKYIDWILKIVDQWVRGMNYDLMDIHHRWLGAKDGDLDTTRLGYKIYSALKRLDAHPKKVDINQLKTVGELVDYVNDLPPTAREQKKIDKDIFENPNDVTVIVKNSKFIIARPLTWEGDKKLARYKSKGADWCTARSDSRHGWDEYNQDGYMFVVISVPNPEIKFQLYYDLGKDAFTEIKDANNEDAQDPMLVYALDEPEFMAYAKRNGLNV